MNGEIHGDFQDAIKNDRIAESIAFFNYEKLGAMVTAADFGRDHDGTAARAILAEHPDYSDGLAVINIELLDGQLPVAWSLPDTGDWPGMVRSLSRADRMALASGVVNDGRHTLVWPWLAYALAKSGDVKSAEGLVRLMPLDCTRCLEFRGRVAEVAGKDAEAAFWYARAAADAPAEPFAATDWGAMLLHKGDTGGAIVKFKLANARGPHFADPLEMWGEALMLENRSDFALAKFEDANRYAPNWGRLHLEWGKALMYAGKKDQAKKQFAVASGLDLSNSDKSVLAEWTARRG